jgi:hypothetical protein
MDDAAAERRLAHILALAAAGFTVGAVTCTDGLWGNW